MAQTIAAVRGIKVFELLYRNPPTHLQALNSALRACALEADRATLRRDMEQGGSLSAYNNHNSFTSTAGQLFEFFLEDRQIQRRPQESHQRRSLKGDNDGRRNQNFRLNVNESERQKVP